MNIYCTGCNKDVEARLVTAKEIYGRTYPGKFWLCYCGAYVGTHHKSNNPTKPLGVLATEELRKAKIHIHALIDPPWRSKKVSRGYIYKKLSRSLGYEYHTGEIRSIAEARRVYREARNIISSLS